MIGESTIGVSTIGGLFVRMCKECMDHARARMYRWMFKQGNHDMAKKKTSKKIIDVVADAITTAETAVMRVGRKAAKAVNSRVKAAKKKVASKKKVATKSAKKAVSKTKKAATKAKTAVKKVAKKAAKKVSKATRGR
ncbi:hypothetical protein BH11PSE3_BH11PSE3_26710 [soil metagenome]